MKNAVRVTIAFVAAGHFICCETQVEAKSGIANLHISEHMILNNYRYAVTVILLEDSLSLFTLSS